MVTPEQMLKFQIKSALHLDGKYVEGKKLDEIVDQIYNAIFDRRNAASIRDVLIEMATKDGE